MLKINMFLIQSIIFICAFLLFQIELIIAKLLLPNYGGSYLVWGSCIVFFQAVLLLGYIYAHIVIKKFGIYQYRKIHLVFIVLPLIFFPGHAIDLGLPQSGIPLTVDVFRLLLLTIGPVFFVLSTISIIGQSWLSGSQLPQRSNPYALYAVSNLGAFAALISYPFLFELFFTLDQQILMWRIAYLVAVILQFIAVRSIEVNPEDKKEKEVVFDLPTKQVYSWFLFGIAGTVMFLSVNNIITAEIDPLPLLWIVTLGIYLLAFVFNFKRKPWCPQWIVNKIHVILALSIVLYFLLRRGALPVLVSLNAFCVILFVLCMYCQNRLYNSRPKNDVHLTKFYVVISLGSFVGGLIVSWIIPLVSTSFIEYLFGVSVIAWASCLGGEQTKVKFSEYFLLVICLLALFIWPIAFPEYSLMGILLLLLLIVVIFIPLARNQRALALCLTVILCYSPVLEYLWYKRDFVYRKRNYYGSIEIFDKLGIRVFRHGTTFHGAQFLADDLKKVPLFYYTPLSPAGRLMTTDIFYFQRIGAVGLGTGTIATFMNPDQSIDFFELDPNVVDVASRFFSFISESEGKINVILGDARQSIGRMPEKYYDLIFMDAFSGDSIPAHLLTKEAIEEYRFHLKDDGIIIFHISNRYYNFVPIIASTGLLMDAKVGMSKGAAGTYSHQTVWAIMTWNDDVFKKLNEDLKWVEIKKEMVRHWKPWTDGYSSVIPILLIDLLEKLKK